MKFIKSIATIALLFLCINGSFAQAENWTNSEKQFYATMKSLCEHFKGKHYDTTQRKLVFEKFVYFDNILADTSKAQIKERIVWFDDLFYRMTHYIDSVGLTNLDAKPTRFFKTNETFFKPYAKGGDLSSFLFVTLTYFDKRRPDEPIGTLLFEPKSRKLAAWIVLNQGGNYRYFLTFNLI